MIHFTCDSCQRPIVSEEETRYVVRMEVFAAVDSKADSGEERDHLQEIDDLLERIDDLDAEEFSESLYQEVRFDLCSECRDRFVKNPLGRLAMAKIGFSEN